MPPHGPATRPRADGRPGPAAVSEPLSHRLLIVLDLRCEQSHQDAHQHRSPVRWPSRPLERQDTLGYHPPFALGDAGGCLQQRHALRSQFRPLDFNEVIEPVKRRRETVTEHDEEVASLRAFLTDQSWRRACRRGAFPTSCPCAARVVPSEIRRSGGPPPCRSQHGCPSTEATGCELSGRIGSQGPNGGYYRRRAAGSLVRCATAHATG